MFLAQYKNKNENLFKKKPKETKNHLAESYYNLFENGHNSTKTNCSINKEKLAQSVLAYKENSKKSISDLGDSKIKRSIKFNCLDYKRNPENKFVELYSSNKLIELILLCLILVLIILNLITKDSDFFNYKRRVEKISKIMQDNYFKEREFALEVIEPIEEIRIDTTSSKIRLDGQTIKLSVKLSFGFDND